MITWLLFACATPDVAAPQAAPPPVLAAPEAPSPATDCVAECTRANMARAVDHTVIEADCRRDCEPGDKPVLE